MSLPLGFCYNVMRIFQQILYRSTDVIIWQFRWHFLVEYFYKNFRNISYLMKNWKSDCNTQGEVEKKILRELTLESLLVCSSQLWSFEFLENPPSRHAFFFSLLSTILILLLQTPIKILSPLSIYLARFQLKRVSTGQQIWCCQTGLIAKIWL